MNGAILIFTLTDVQPLMKPKVRFCTKPSFLVVSYPDFPYRKGSLAFNGRFLVFCKDAHAFEIANEMELLLI